MRLILFTLLFFNFLVLPAAHTIEFNQYELMRVESSKEDQQKVPYRAVGRFKDIGCTAFHVAPKVLMTAAHCVWDSDNEKLIWSGFYPALNSSWLMFKDYLEPERVYVPTEYKDSQKPEYDYALIQVEGDPVHEYLELSEDPEQGYLKAMLVGYPSSQSFGHMYYSECPMRSDCLRTAEWVYLCDTSSGMSGAPIIVENDGDFEVVGVHSGGYENNNGHSSNIGVAFSEDKMSFIKDMIAHLEEL